MEEWGRHRSRLKTEMARRVQARQGLKKMLSTSMDEKKVDLTNKREDSLESKMDRLRVNRAISEAKKLTG